MPVQAAGFSRLYTNVFVCITVFLQIRACVTSGSAECSCVFIHLNKIVSAYYHNGDDVSDWNFYTPSQKNMRFSLFIVYF